MLKPKRDGRKFGLTMAGAFTVFALVLLYFRKTNAAVILGGLALVFAATALTFPRLLEPVEVVWMAFARVLGAINTRIIMSVFYFLLIVPLGLVLRLIGKDEMKRRRWLAGHTTNWEDYRARQRDERHYENMF